MSLLDRIAGRCAYLDANVFIYAVERAAPWAEVVTPLFDALDEGAVETVTSEITLAEALVRPFRDADSVGLRAFARSVKTRPGLTVEPVTRSVLVEAARLRAERGALRLPDAIHAATARLSGCAVLVTNDDRLRAVPGVEVVRLAEVV